MDRNSIFIAPECIGTHIELVAVNPSFYDTEGNRHPEVVSTRYEVLLRDHKSERLSVTIPGPAQIDEPLSGYGQMVEFKDLVVRPYAKAVSANYATLAFSASAAGIKAVPESKAKT